MLDCLALLVPLGALALVIIRTVATSLVVYHDPANPVYETGDYYRYVNMALPNDDPRYVYHQPFIYRILVPGTVHLLSMIGLPFRTGFFSITVMSLAISTIGIFFLVRGIGLSRGTAMSAALVSLPVTAMQIVQHVIPLYFPPLSLLHVWRIEISKHCQHNKLLGFYNTFSRST